MVSDSKLQLISSSWIKKPKKEVKSCKKSQIGSTRLSSPCPQMEPQPHTAAMPAAVPANPPGTEVPAALGIPGAVRQMRAIISEWDMVETPPSPPSYFFDEPKFPAVGTILKEPWTDTPDSIGAFDMDWENAYIRTLGEAIERSCQAHPRGRKKDLQYSTYEELENFAFDPVPYFPFSQDEKFRAEIRKKKIYWYPAQDFRSGEEKLLPLRLSFLFGCKDDDVLDSIRTTNGTAMWNNKVGAVFNGLCELIERDAFFIHYLSKRTSSRIALSKLNSQELIDIKNYIEKYRLEVHLFNITLEFNLPVIMCIIIDRTGIGPSISIGTKCAPNVNHAIKHAILEAVQIRYFSRLNKLQSEMGMVSTNMINRILNWYGTENIEKIDFLLNSERYSTPKSYDGSINNFLMNFKYDIFVSDVTLPNMNGFKVVKVNVPELLPLYFFDDHKPIYNDRVRKYLDGVEINEIPHPFL